MQNKTNNSLLDKIVMQEALPFQNESSDSDAVATDLENNEDHDEPYYCTEPCQDIADCYMLIDSLVKDILTLEEEMIRWRQALLKHLSPIDAQNLKSDIYDNLARRYYDNECYQTYIKLAYDGVDPMESDEHSQMLIRLRDGIDETSVTL